MENEEINGLVWDFLARKGLDYTLEEIVDEIGLPKVKLQSALVRLRNVKLVEQFHQGSQVAYRANRRLGALEWGQAVSLGISLISLEEHAQLTREEQKQALYMATHGVLEKHLEDMKQEKQQKREELLQGRAASKAAASDIAQIMNDCKAALVEVQESKVINPEDQRVASLLEEVNAKMSRAYDDLVRSIRGSR